MGDLERKQIAFDLSISKLKEFYPYEPYNRAYDDIKSFMKKYDFMWRQGSIYVSKKPIKTSTVSKIIKKLSKEQPWLNRCVNAFDVTSIGKTHSLKHIFEKAVIVENKKINDIVKDIREAGYRPTKRLVACMEKVNDAAGKQCSIRNLKSEVKNNPDNAALKKAAAGAIKEMARQDQLQAAKQPVKEPVQHG